MALSWDLYFIPANKSQYFILYLGKAGWQQHKKKYLKKKATIAWPPDVIYFLTYSERVIRILYFVDFLNKVLFPQRRVGVSGGPRMGRFSAPWGPSGLRTAARGGMEAGTGQGRADLQGALGKARTRKSRVQVPGRPLSERGPSWSHPPGEAETCPRPGRGRLQPPQRSPGLALGRSPVSAQPAGPSGASWHWRLNPAAPSRAAWGTHSASCSLTGSTPGHGWGRHWATGL